MKGRRVVRKVKWPCFYSSASDPRRQLPVNVRAGLATVGHALFKAPCGTIDIQHHVHLLSISDELLHPQCRSGEDVSQFMPVHGDIFY